MANYYEELKITPQANVAEIETAIDGLYNQWRQAVTHPDPAVVDEANRNLRVLEQMRTILIDPDKRAIYDAGIGLGGAGGLADPTTVLRPMAPPRPKPATQSSNDAPETLWECPKCKTQNPEWTQYCLKCATMLVRRCPECGQMKSLVKTGVCGNCGIPYGAASQRVELKTYMSSLNESIQTHQEIASSLHNQIIPTTHSARNMAIALGIVGVILSALAGAGGDLRAAMFVALFFAIVAFVMVAVQRSHIRKVTKANNSIESQLAAENAEISERQRELQEATETFQALGRR